MILNDFIIRTEQGLYCPYGSFYLDPSTAVDQALVSHAHGDHACRDNKHVFCTPETADIMRLRYKKSAGAAFTLKTYGESFELNGVSVTFHSAGHILGSAQILLEYKNVRYLYTGDYKLQEDATCTAIAFIKADVLITETTFAHPDTQHPDPIAEIKKLNEHTENVLLGTYSLGKAQRLTRLINDHCPDRKVAVHFQILPLHQLHEKWNINLGKYQIYTRKIMKEVEKNYVYLVPPLTFKSYARATNVCRAFASGWKNLQNHNDLQLLISDHVDWNDILQMIERVKPTEVWTVHGDGAHLKAHFKGKIPIKTL
jgi:putative mRNA 3-end processing factor